MSHWITSHPDFGIDYQARTVLIKSDSSSTKQQSDEMLEDIKAIVEFEPNGIVHIAVFLCFTQVV